MNNRQRGKNTERAIAKRVNGKRVGTMGGEDIQHPWMSIEAKSRVACVVEKWMEQSERNAPDNKIPVVVVHIHGKRHDDDLICFRLKDYQEYYGNVMNKLP